MSIVYPGKFVRNGSRYVRLTQAQFDELANYSASIPTGTTIGKQWKRREPYQDGPPGTVHKWYMGEYIESEREGYVEVAWWRIEILTEREEQIAHVIPNGYDGQGRPIFHFNGSDGNVIERKRQRNA